ncbi:MAG: redoxin domain-containing protein [Gemmatimonadota bacterium]|nr:MAG: redoxin domain-containing protein [Gemmatimonadota bacterium]
MTIHPRFATLAEYAQSELSDKRRARVSSHLIACPECQATVRSIVRIGELARALYSVEPPADTMQKVRERWKAGDRIILPTAESVPSRRPHYRLVGVGAAVALLVCAVVFFGPRTARADRSELRFTPGTPEPGDTIAVEYVSTSWLGTAEHLYLRARYRTAHGQPYNRGAHHRTISQLERTAPGSYRGSFVLPDSVVYALFAVEDSGGRRVDSNGRRFWELLAHDGGKPTFQTLVQRQNDLIGRNWEAALATAQAATELHPEVPLAWYYLRSYQAALNQAATDAPASHDQANRFYEFHSALQGRPDLTGDDIGGMLWLGRISSADTISIVYWRRRLLEEAPAHPLAVQERVLETVVLDGGDLGRTVRDLETLWQEVGPAHPSLPRLGLEAAIQLRDTAAITTWLERRDTVDPWAAVNNSMRLLDIPALRQHGLERLRAELRRLMRAGRLNRSLEESAGEWDSAREDRVQTILAAIGKGLVMSGRVTEGLDSLEQAAAHSWNLSAFKMIADVKFELRDSAGAVSMLSRLAVDPSTQPALADSIHSVGAELLGVPGWLRTIERARVLMHERTLAEASNYFLRLDVAVADRHGTSGLLSDILADQVTVVAFWSRSCAPSVNQIPQIQEVTDRLNARGISIVVITSEEVSPALTRFLAERGVDFPVYHDLNGQALRAFSSWGTPEYYVLDAHGRLRFARVPLEDVERFAEALK